MLPQSPIKSSTLSTGSRSPVKRKRDGLLRSLSKNKNPALSELTAAPISQIQKSYSCLLPGYEGCITSAIPLTKEHFIDAYSKGKWNLSNVSCPEFIKNQGSMIPPESYNESQRLKAVRKYLNLDHWNIYEKDFKKIVSNLIRQCNVNGASISLIDENRQVVKFSYSLTISECPRKISIDSHAILSSQYFIILDASKDWRFQNNPLVKNFPKIRLYAGVPLITNDNQVIGILAIFDGFSRNEFDSNYLYKLQMTAKEIMNLLSNNVDNEQKNLPLKNFSTPLQNKTNLLNQIGRATSSSQLSNQKNLSIYEKDGSGSQYIQNHNFRFGKHEYNEKDINNAELYKNLLNSTNFRTAANILSKLIVEKLNLDIVFIIEIRVTEIFKIDPEFFPEGNEIEAENFKFADKLQRVDKEHISVRVINSYPNEIFGDFEINDDSIKALYYRSLSSEFGISIRSKTISSRCNNGICMPFHRLPSKLVRKKRYNKSKKQNNFDPIELYLKSGGFLIGAFSENEREITHDDINYIFNGANIYRKMYISTLT